MNTHNIEPMKYGGNRSDDYVTGWNDCYAAIEADRQQKGVVVVTRTQDGEIVAVTRQDDEGRILSVIAEADRKRRGEPVKVPSEEEIEALAFEYCDETGAGGDCPRFIGTQSITRLIRALLSRYGSGQPAASAEPSGYAYRYQDGIRFNDGREVNGCKPTETLPYWFGAAPVAQEPVAFLCRECDEEGWSTYVVMPNERPPSSDLMHVTPLYAAPIAAQAQAVVNKQLTTEPSVQDRQDAARYRLLRRGQHWSVINGIGEALRADSLDAAIDAARASLQEKSHDGS